MKFSKYHALGNDYLVIDPKDLDKELTAAEIKILCNQQYGIGSDGILYGPLPSIASDFKLRIFNPDASEAEKSGNGLRIFARYLWDQAFVADQPFSIETQGGNVIAMVSPDGKSVKVEMGQVRFTHQLAVFSPIHCEVISLTDIKFEFYRANVGNPHCVIPVDLLSANLAKKYGPLIEKNALFNNRTNVQFMKVIDRNNVQIEIWERGAGYTLSSGSSSTAAASVAYALGLCDAQISVHTPGGIIEIELNDEFYATMTGPVCKIADGFLANEALE